MASVDSAGRKETLFEAIALMGKAFASPRRLELIDLLAQGSRSVEELANASGQSNANTSQHLQALHAAGLVTRRRDGLRVRYALAGDDVLALWLGLREASATRLAEVQRAAREYLGDEVEAIGREELIARLARGDVVLVDVRPAEEFQAGHIDGAQSIPIEELHRRLDELPDDREVVAYCRGPFCAYAHEAVRTLRAEADPRDALKKAGPNGVYQTRRRPHDHRDSPSRHHRARAARQAHVRGGGARTRARIPLRDGPGAGRTAWLSRR